MATRILALLVLTFSLSGCLVATTAGVEGASVASQERSVSDASSDARIRLNIDDRLFKQNVDLFRAVDTTVTEGRVLLTGNVAEPEDRVKASELVWQVPGVRQLMNNLEVRNDTGAGNYAKDSWIIAKLRTQLIWAKNVISINYTIDCVNRAVYLMGIAQDQMELDRVIKLARETDGVKDVISYVRLKNDLPSPFPVEKSTTP